MKENQTNRQRTNRATKESSWLFYGVWMLLPLILSLVVIPGKADRLATQDRPVAQDDIFEGNEDELLFGLVLLNDTDPDNDDFSVTTTPVVDVTHGSLTLNYNGSFLYLPDLHFAGQDTFYYEVCDEEGCDTARVVLEITEVNDPPEAYPDQSRALKGAKAELSVLKNDVDVEASIAPSTFTVLSSKGGGSLDFDTTTGVFSVDYSSVSSYLGMDSIVYQVCDDGGACDTSLVVIEVVETISELIDIVEDQGYAIYDTSSVGSTIVAFELVAPDSISTYDFSILSGNEAGLFSIQSGGEVVLNEELDITEQENHFLVLRVTTPEVEALADTAILTIQVRSDTYHEVTLYGKSNVNANSLASFEIQPAYSFYSYAWSYPDTNATLVGATGLTNQVIFTEDAQTDSLKVVVTYRQSGLVVDTLIHVIEVCEESLFNLPDLDCVPGVPSDFCTGPYIQSIDFGSFRQISDCTPSGYADYTSNCAFAEWYLGDVYTLELQLGGDVEERIHIGVWLDLDNSGSFEANELLTTTEANSTPFFIPNLKIPLDGVEEGAQRLRIRMRTNGAFAADESCPVSSDIGETEDFMVTVNPFERLIASNLVTPNEDGINDFFVVRGVDGDVANELSIFDRQGVVLFTAENYQNDWAGEGQDGELLPSGTYFYMYKNGEDYLKGFIQLNF